MSYDGFVGAFFVGKTFEKVFPTPFSKLFIDFSYAGVCFCLSYFASGRRFVLGSASADLIGKAREPLRGANIFDL